MELGGEIVGHFVECLGLGQTPSDQLPAYREGGEAPRLSLPPTAASNEVTFRYGLTRSPELRDWFFEAVQGRFERKDLTVVLFDEDGRTRRRRWTLTSAWPTGWRAAELSTVADEVAIEQLVVAYESSVVVD